MNNQVDFRPTSLRLALKSRPALSSCLCTDRRAGGLPLVLVASPRAALTLAPWRGAGALAPTALTSSAARLWPIADPAPPHSRCRGCSAGVALCAAVSPGRSLICPSDLTRRETRETDASLELIPPRRMRSLGLHGGREVALELLQSRNLTRRRSASPSLLQTPRSLGVEALGNGR